MLTKQALTIGINNYVPTRLALRPCLNDANDVSNALRSVGFRVQTALDTNLDSTKSNIRHFIHSIQPGAVILFYFSGHGVQSNGNNYLIPTNATGISADNIKSTAIDVQELIDDMYKKGPRVVIGILDCCRTDAPDDPLRDRSTPHDNALHGTRRGLAPMRPPSSTILVYACAANDTASARSKYGRNSLYTYHLLRYLRTPDVDIETVFKQVASDVQKDSNNEQVPYRYTSCNEIIYLTSNKIIKTPMFPQHMQQMPILQPPLVNHHANAYAGLYRPELQHNNFQHQLNGHFRIPVQPSPVKNKSPHAQRSPHGHGHPPGKDPHHRR